MNTRNKKINEDIIRMNSAHVSQVAVIEKQVFSVPWSARAFEEAIDGNCTLFFVAVVGEKVVGYCGIYLAADEGEITKVAVIPEYRQNQIAWRLLQEMMGQAADKGARQFFLEVRSSNIPAVRLYEKAGFQTAGRRKNYYQYPTEDALVMKCCYFADK